MHKLDIWAFGDAHVGTDLSFGRKSLEEAIIQSESIGGFKWDIAIDVGDMSGGQDVPEDSEGRELVRQMGALKEHKREDIYSVAGNHDRGLPGEEELAWWRKWVDPMGENPALSGVDNMKRPFPVKGEFSRYSFEAGNILFLMMSDVNEPTRKIGRGVLGGNPGGVVTGSTFNWWKDMVTGNRDRIVISVHHYVLKDTTVASGDWEGMKKDETGNYISGYHGYKEGGTPRGASYLYWTDSKPGGGYFEKFLEENPGSCALWLGGHTHTNPDDNYGGKTHIETKWGTHFINVCALTAYHVRHSTVPMSRLLSFKHGSDEVLVRCYLHDNSYGKQGFYEPAQRILKLGKKVDLKGAHDGFQG